MNYENKMNANLKKFIETIPERDIWDLIYLNKIQHHEDVIHAVTEHFHEGKFHKSEGVHYMDIADEVNHRKSHMKFLTLKNN